VLYDGAALLFCTTGCALDEGFAAAVEARLVAELEGGEEPFEWVDRRYDEDRGV
jgi:hypothetical protein